MALILKHAFVNTVPEDPNSGTPGGPVGPTEWNAPHTLTQAATTLLGRGENTAGSTEEISLVNDTNVTLALSAGALTAGWNGTLAASRLNANVVQGITNDTNVTGSISAQVLTLGWSGTLAAARLNSNVVQGVTNDTNVTGSISTQNLTLGWTGALAVTRGGTGTGTFVLGDTLYSNAANSLARLAGNTTTARNFLRQTGTGTVSAAPVWDTILAADVPGSALTAANDTNVTLTTGGSASTALLNAASITAGWTGTLSVGRGGTGVGTFTTNGVLYGNTTSAIQVTAQGGANTVLTANAGAPSFSSSPTIGTSVTTPLLIGGTAAGSTLTLESTSGAGTSDFISFKTASQVEGMRLDTNSTLNLYGNNSLGFPLIIQSTFYSASSQFAIQGYNSGTGGNMAALFKNYNNDAFGDSIQMHYFRGTSASPAAVVSGDEIGSLTWYGATSAVSGGQEKLAGRIGCFVDGTPVANTATPGRLSFRTSTNASNSPVEHLRIDSVGLCSFTNGSFGYGLSGNGDGGTVTQLTSRGTGVTINKVCGAITLFAAAPTVGTWVSFNVSNNKVAATDSVIVGFASGTDTYVACVSAIAAGSFKISFMSISGTTSDSPVINFAVIKGVTS